MLSINNSLKAVSRKITPIMQKSNFTIHCVMNKDVWKLGKLNHVAIAVPDLEKSASLYKNIFGADVSAKQDLPDHGVSTVFVNLPNTKLELLHPLSKDSPISAFLAKNKNGGLHHICIEVEDINVTVAALKKDGIRTLTNEPVIGAHGKPVIFCHPKDCNGILLEFEQE